MKKIAFALLIAANVGLLLTLVAGSWSVEPARAQGFVTNDVSMISARLDGDEDLLYLVDLKTGEMVGLRYDKQDEELVRYEGLNLLPAAERRKRR
jgi:hypothetical protein